MPVMVFIYDASPCGCWAAAPDAFAPRALGPTCAHGNRWRWLTAHLLDARNPDPLWPGPPALLGCTVEIAAVAS